ncbi:MAG TPA: hypothetical protein VN986_00350 [Actinomycetota bacterium]|nr:hypothetical protein [Actinomycetota bacterium]
MDTTVVLDLRRARRRRRLQKIDISELLYRGYLTALGVGVAVYALSNLPQDRRVTAGQIASVAHHGPALIGVGVAVLVALAVRSGARGGPLVLEAPDIQHVLLSPYSRGRALRQPALQKVRSTILGWTGVGAVAGLLASKRFPGSVASWLASCLAAGALTGAFIVGAGLVASGRRLRVRWAFLIALALIAWGLVDAVYGVVTSPFTLIGRVALYPIAGDGWAWLVALPVAGLLALGLSGVGGISLESAMRRASLVGQLRFALTVRDLRTVVVLSRLLAEERPRRRPLIHLRPGHGPALAVWKRDWQGVLRWPLSRLVRVLVLGAVAGAALRGVWAGTTPLLAVAGVAMWLAAMDADVGLAGEVDHAERGRSVPVDEGSLLLHHLPAAVAVVTFVAAAGGILGAQVGGWSLRAVQIGLAVMVPAAIGAVAGATVSTVRSVYGTGSGMFAFSPESTGLSLVIREALPPAIATAGVVSVWAARHLAKHESLQLNVALSWAWLPFLLAGAVVVWLSQRGLK